MGDARGGGAEAECFGESRHPRPGGGGVMDASTNPRWLLGNAKKKKKVHECREVRAVRGCGVAAARHSCCSAAVLGGHTAADTRHQGAASGYLIVVEGASRRWNGVTKFSEYNVGVFIH